MAIVDVASRCRGYELFGTLIYAVYGAASQYEQQP
jgi:hypothetical protein